MDANAWAAVAAIAAAATAVVTLVIALANTAAAWTTAHSADFSNCLDAVAKLGEAQRRVRDAKEEPTRQFEMRELLNLMEALALLENDKKLAPSTRKFTEKFLEEAYAFLQADDGNRDFLDSSVTGADTFAELMKFARKRRGRIEALTKHYKQQKKQA